MTTAQVERVRPPSYSIAVTLILRLASPVFSAALGESNGERYLDKKLYQHYSDLRTVVQQLLDTRATSLPLAMHTRMLLALHFAHDLAHRSDEYSPFRREPMERCDCKTAQTIRDVCARFTEEPA